MELDPAYEHGAVPFSLAIYFIGLPASAGRDLERSAELFAQSVADAPTSLLAPWGRAKYLARPEPAIARLSARISSGCWRRTPPGRRARCAGTSTFNAMPASCWAGSRTCIESPAVGRRRRELQAQGGVMESTDLKLLRDLLTGEKLVTLAVVIDGAPVAGVLPFLAEPGLVTLLVHTSKLARHSRGLTPGAPFSAAIHLPLAPGLDALQSQRVVLEGHVETVLLGGAGSDHSRLGAGLPERRDDRGSRRLHLPPPAARGRPADLRLRPRLRPHAAPLGGGSRARSLSHGRMPAAVSDPFEVGGLAVERLVEPDASPASVTSRG